MRKKIVPLAHGIPDFEGNFWCINAMGLTALMTILLRQLPFGGH